MSSRSYTCMTGIMLFNLKWQVERVLCKKYLDKESILCYN